MKKLSVMSLVLVSSMFGSQLFAGAREAQNVANTARNASALVSRVLARGGAGGGGGVGIPHNPGMPQGPGIPGGGQGPRFPWMHENDAVALPIFMQASGHLNNAANAAFESLNAFLGGNIQFGVFKFTTACSLLSIGKLALSRANLAALFPPVGFLGVFGPEIMTTLNEIEATRNMNGCL